MSTTKSRKGVKRRVSSSSHTLTYAWVIKLDDKTEVESSRIDPSFLHSNQPIYFARSGNEHDYNTLAHADLFDTKDSADFYVGCEPGIRDRAVKVRVVIEEVAP